MEMGLVCPTGKISFPFSQAVTAILPSPANVSVDLGAWLRNLATPKNLELFKGAGVLGAEMVLLRKRGYSCPVDCGGLTRSLQPVGTGLVTGLLATSCAVFLFRAVANQKATIEESIQDAIENVSDQDGDPSAGGKIVSTAVEYLREGTELPSFYQPLALLSPTSHTPERVVLMAAPTSLAVTLFLFNFK